MAGASMNDIKSRMKSVRGTMQITKAMELVATSKLRRAKERAESARPYCELLTKTIKSIASVDGYSLSVFGTPKTDRTLAVVIAGDRGLAGGYNSGIFKLAKSLAEQGENTVVLPVGKKAKEYYLRHRLDVKDLGLGVVADVGVGDCIKAGEEITKLIRDGEIGRVVLFYTEFKSMISQVPKSAVLFPIGNDENAEKTSTGEPILTEEPEEFAARVMPGYIGGALFAAVCESVASESGARRTAMNAANKNAAEMIDTLMLKFNRARQAAITQEITEIVSGAEAL